MADYSSNAPLVDVWGRVGFMTDDQSLRLSMNKLPSRTAVSQYLVTQVFEHGFQFTPFDVGSDGLGTKSLNSFLMLGHVVRYPAQLDCN